MDKAKPNNFDTNFTGLALVGYEAANSPWLQTTLPLADWQSGFYPNGEQWVKITPPGEDEHVLVVVQLSDQEPLAQQLQRSYLLIQTLASYTQKITLFLPYMPYSLQDRETQPGQAVASNLLGQQYAAAGADQVILFEVHSPHNFDAWPIPVWHIQATEVLVAGLQANFDLTNCTLIAPDKGAASRVQEIGQQLNCPVVTLQKRRLGPGEVVIAPLAGQSIHTAQVVIIDDLINTGGTLLETIKQLHQANPQLAVSIAVIHGLFASGAFSKLQRSGLSNLLFTDSFQASVDYTWSNLKVLAIKPNMLGVK